MQVYPTGATFRGSICYAAGMTTDTDITLSGPFTAIDASGRAHEVRAIRIFDEGYAMIDVYVDFAKPLEPGMYRDVVLTGQIVAHLRTLGYVGPDFGPSDSALQERKLIVLDAPEQFHAFAKRRGWKDLAAEFDDA